MVKLLNKGFKPHEKVLLGFKYDFGKEEVATIAKISRGACDYHDDGVFLLLIYLVRCAYNLEAKGRSVSEIEK